MTEITDSFCERCGTKYTFETPKPTRKGRARLLARAAQHFVLQDGTSINDAVQAAKTELETDVNAEFTAKFHSTFNFCMSCRQYTCEACWNDRASACISCVPNEWHDEPRAEAALATAAFAEAAAAQRPDVLQWPEVDLLAAHAAVDGNGNGNGNGNDAPHSFLPEPAEAAATAEPPALAIEPAEATAAFETATPAETVAETPPPAALSAYVEPAIARSQDVDAAFEPASDADPWRDLRFSDDAEPRDVAIEPEEILTPDELAEIAARLEAETRPDLGLTLEELAEITGTVRVHAEPELDLTVDELAEIGASVGASMVAEPVEAVAEPVEAVAEPVEAVAEPVEAVAEAEHLQRRGFLSRLTRRHDTAPDAAAAAGVEPDVAASVPHWPAATAWDERPHRTYATVDWSEWDAEQSARPIAEERPADAPSVSPIVEVAEPAPIVEAAEPAPIVEVAEPVVAFAEPEPIAAAEPAAAEPVVETVEPAMAPAQPEPVAPAPEPEPIAAVAEPVVPAAPELVVAQPAPPATPEPRREPEPARPAPEPIRPAPSPASPAPQWPAAAALWAPREPATPPWPAPQPGPHVARPNPFAAPPPQWQQTATPQRTPGTRSCKSCALPISTSARFCRRCGTQQDAEPVHAAAQVTR